MKSGSKTIPLARPNFSNLELEAVARVLESRHVTQGPEVAAFEKELAAFTGDRDVVAVSSGGSSLFMALVACGVRHGDEVIVPDFVFPAAALCSLFNGAVPVPANIDSETLALTPQSVRQRLTDKTAAVVVVHPFGIPADVEGVMSVLPDGIDVIEDCACALGGLTSGGAVTGTVGRFGCYSFHPRKSITTGEGGCITSRGSDTKNLRLLRDYGRSGRGFGDIFSAVGMNFRLSDLAGAIGRVQLGRIRQSIEIRTGLFQLYSERLSSLPGVRIPAGFRQKGNTYQSFVIEIDRDPVPVVATLAGSGVMSGPSAHALSMQTVFRTRFPEMAASCDGTGARLATRTIALPLFDDMTTDDVHTVCDVLERTMTSQ